MKLTLSENIRRYRKERKLTQEQFAEVLGVTAGAVHKWEAGLSVPELNLIMEMADFFDLSVDALLGYKQKDNRIASTIQRLNDYSRIMDPTALTEVQKALQKYPNSFEIVYTCAYIYQIYGTKPGKMEYLRKALELFEQARLLLVQNTNPQISEQTIYANMASLYIMTGDQEKGIDLLKRYNAGGLNNDTIGVSLALYLGRPEEAEPYLSNALLNATATLLNCVAGYLFVFLSRNNLESAEGILTWGKQTLDGIQSSGVPNPVERKERPGSTQEPGGSTPASGKNTQAAIVSDYIDKINAEFLVLHAYIQLASGREGEAAISLEKAGRLAAAFDANPNYGLNSIRYISVSEDINVHDSLGSTAMESIDTILKWLKTPELTKMWKEAFRRACKERKQP